MAAGELPDVTPVLKTVVKEDYPLYYLPIDDLGYIVDDVYFYEEGVSADGKLYALSSGVSYNGITYSKIAFEKAGIEKVPTTTEELYAACEKLKAVDVIPLATVSNIAKKLLKDPKLKIYEVGVDVGYKEPVSFNRAFKKVVGVSPSKYRKLIK